MSWRPLLEGDDAAPAHEAIQAIATDLAAHAIDRPDLDEGHAGQALFAAYLAAAGHPAEADRATNALEQALSGLDRTGGPWLLDGLSGIAWTAAHLSGELIELDEETAAGLDGLAARILAAEPWPFMWEYVAGLVGLGVYAIERGAVDLQARAIDHLQWLAETSAAGATWRSPSPPDAADLEAGGYHNLGLAHGVVGVIGFLARAVEAGADGHALLADAVRWLLAHDSGDPAGRFPYWVGRPPPPGRRDGWCYGDTAVAIAIVRAGRALGEPAWIERGRAVALDAARRVPDLDLHPSLCHGTIGRAHIFNRLAQATGSDELGEAARAWYGQTLARRRAGSGVGGYRGESALADHGLLLGATGIGLGLLAAVSPVEPAWDRALLLDLQTYG